MPVVLRVPVLPRPAARRAWLRAWAAALSVSLGWALPSWAQPPAGGAVRGVAYDSLAGRPLAGALVFVEGSVSSAVADGAGRFAITAVPAGRQLVTVEHPALEAAGLSALTVAAEVPSGGAAQVAVATPSRVAVWRRACGGEPPSAGGVLFGDVRDLQGDARLVGARVVASWVGVAVAGGRVRAEVRVVAAETDSVGAYRLCGVPTDQVVEVRAVAGADSSGRAPVRFAGPTLARANLLVARAADGIQTRGGVTGVVRDTAGRLRPGVRVRVDGVPTAETVTGPDGAFVLTDVPAGTQAVVVQAPGGVARAEALVVRTGAATPVELTLRPEEKVTRVVTRVATPTVPSMERSARVGPSREWEARRRIAGPR